MTVRTLLRTLIAAQNTFGARAKVSALTAALLAASLGGCVVYDRGYSDDYYGDSSSRRSFSDPISFLDVEWAIDGEFGSSICQAVGSDLADIVIYDRTDTVVFHETEPCENGHLELDVDPGWYDVNVTLLDDREEPISDTVYADTTVADAEAVVLTLDFDSSFFF